MSSFTRKAIGSILGLLPLLVLGTGEATAGETKFLIGGFVGAGREGNFFQSSRFPTAENVVLPGLLFQLNHQTPTLNLDTSDRPALLYPVNLTEFYSVAQRFEFLMTHQPTRRFTYLIEDYAVVSPIVSLPGQVGLGPILAPTRSEHWSNHAKFELRGYVSERVAVVSDVRSEIYRYELPTLVDSKGIGVNAGILVGFERHEVEFRVGYAGFGFASDNSESGPTAWATYRALASPRHNFVLELGVFALQPGQEEGESPQEEFRSWRGRVQWNGEYPRFNASVGFLRIPTAGGGLRGSSVNMSMIGSIRFSPTPRFEYGFDGTISNNLASFLSTEPGFEGERSQGKFASFSARADWGINRWVGLFGNVQYIWQESNDPRFADLAYPRAIVGFAFTIFETGRPYRSPLDWMTFR